MIGRYVMGWPVPPMRLAAIVVGLAGLAAMLGADGAAPIPRGAGEWMALLAGLLWSVATTGVRALSAMAPVEAAFVFALGALAASCLLAPLLAPMPGAGALDAAARALGFAFASGGLWWALSVAALMWATVRLEPARVGVLLMAEVVVGAA